MTEVAINSPQSQKDVVGAMVMMYIIRAYRKVIAAKILFRFFTGSILTDIHKFQHVTVIFLELFPDALMLFHL